MTSCLWRGAVVASALLLALLLPTSTRAAAVGGGAASDVNEDAAIMRSLRLALFENARDLIDDRPGWHPAHISDPCGGWSYVQCDADGHVISLVIWHHTEVLAGIRTDPLRGNSSTGAEGGPAPPPIAPLSLLDALAGLARLPRLNVLQLVHNKDWMPEGGIPTQWVAPGAFPSLTKLTLIAHTLGNGALPDIQPGALPCLQMLVLYLDDLRASLPASWGASPAVLPSLQGLDVQLGFAGTLPAAWVAGFPQLRSLDIHSRSHMAAAHLKHGWEGRGGNLLPRDQPPPPLPTGGLPGILPAEWAAGFGRLQSMRLPGLGIQGSLPEAWLQGGFPELHNLDLSANEVTGTLPSEIFHNHPWLERLNLEMNLLSGSLPERWAASHVRALEVGFNALTGPAFPAAWLQDGAMPRLEGLSLSHNALTGTVPANLTWPNLTFMDLMHTGVGGTIPQAWCDSLLAHSDVKDRLWIAGSGVDPLLPNCPNRTWASKRLIDLMGAVKEPGAAAAGQPAAGLAPGLGSLGVVFAAVLAGAGLWRRKLLRQGRQLQHTVEQTLGAAEEGGLGGHSAGIPAAGDVPGGLASFAARSKKERLAALLGAALRDPRPGIEMLPLRGAPQALAHQLTSQRTLSAASRQLGHPVDSQSLLAVGGPGSSRGTSAGSTGEWGWGLETDSLCLAPGQLQFVTDANGGLVELGQGHFAVVYLAQLPGAEVAVKVFELLPRTDLQAVWDEVALLHQCAHERIVPLFGVAVQGPLLLLVTGLMRGGSLRAALQRQSRRPALQWYARGRQVALDVACGLDYLHTQLQVLHSDLSSSNVLLDDDCRACIADLGVARFVGADMRSVAGFCPTHAAPEQILGHRCTLAADLYSFGLLLIQLATQQAGVQHRGDWRMPLVPDECPQGVVDLIEECISSDPQRRPSAAQALQRLRLIT